MTTTTAIADISAEDWAALDMDSVHFGGIGTWGQRCEPPGEMIRQALALIHGDAAPSLDGYAWDAEARAHGQEPETTVRELWLRRHARWDHDSPYCTVSSIVTGASSDCTEVFLAVLADGETT